MTGQDEQPWKSSVTGALPSYEWHTMDVAAYEAVLDLINSAVGAYSARISAEYKKQEPDRAVIDAALAAQKLLADERRNLRSDDRARVDEAGRYYRRLIEDIRNGRAFGSGE
ncbi:hypothetical protein AB0H49_18225 [Nocardia sp. NPDC050713]|uniref:hypothetical protein n=1 Tax=unclassified Nocardia TaxID=2637762 RepID=UPI0033B1067F